MTTARNTTEVYPTGDEWRFRVKGFNGEILAQSEGYTTKGAAEKGLRALRRALVPGGPPPCDCGKEGNPLP